MSFDISLTCTSALLTVISGLYIFLAASLANRVSSSDKATYLNAAESLWDWFFSSGIVQSSGYVQDGVNVDGCSVTGDYFSYNQGVILGAAAELYKATGNADYITQVTPIANTNVAANSDFNNGNDIEDECGGSGCDTTSQLFKGAFFRGLARLNEVAPNSVWADYLTNNAQALWNDDLSVQNVNGESECLTGEYIPGPAGSTFDSVIQAASLALLDAAIIVT